MSPRSDRAPFDAGTFRRIALGHADAIEGSHMGHPDFRLHGRIFATIAPGGTRGMVNVTPEQQASLVTEYPETFAPENGAWGRQGCTRVTFARADEEIVGEAVTMAWRRALAAGPTRPRPTRPRPRSRG